MERPYGEGLGHQVWLEAVEAVEGHEEGEGPQVVGLIVLLGMLPQQILLDGVE